MMSTAALGGRRRILIEHELYGVVSIGNLQIDPGKHLTGFTASPSLFETKYVCVKPVLGIQMGDNDSDVLHAVGDRLVAHEFSLGKHRLTIGHILRHLYGVAFRVGNVKTQISDSGPMWLSRNLHPFRREIHPERLNI